MLTTSSATRTSSDPAYSQFEKLIADRVASLRGPLFTTNACGLFEAYLAGIPAEHRQHYTCNCCRRFIEKYGGLVAIDESGTTTSMIWSFGPSVLPPIFGPICHNLMQKVEQAKITGVFINGEKTWGTPSNVPGPLSKFQGVRWTHLSGHPAEVFKSPIKTASQAEAEKLQDYIMLKRGLSEIPMEAVVQAVRVLEADAVDRSEKTLGIAKWLLDLHRSIADVRGMTKDNLIWLAVAKAPLGWCHIRSTMISTLLDDVVAGLSFDAIKARWDAKMHPLKYQRPTTISDGNIEQANRIVAKLQSEGALQRRFARIDDVIALWKPRQEEKQDKPKTGGAFDHLKTKPSIIKPVELPASKIAWEKFRDTVLPSATKIEVGISNSRLGFFGMVTAANPDAPPILQWDGLYNLPRNPVSWYFYHSGSTPANWGIISGWHAVDAVCLKPCHWQVPDKFAHQGNSVFFVISAMKDQQHTTGAGFFPECLRSEYHEIRPAMEAYSRSAAIAGREEGTANGIALDKGIPLTIRIHSGGSWTDYKVELE